jgi:hypothetical protein
MNARFCIRLTPNFSWVPETEWAEEPFQRFFIQVQETVETVSWVPTIARTWLKPGANAREFQPSPLLSTRTHFYDPEIPISL